MSRIGKNPIIIPDGVNVDLNGNIVNVSGPKGNLSRELLSQVTLKLEGNSIIVNKVGDNKFARSYFGTARQLVNNMVEGVTKGYEKRLQLIGVGYKAAMDGKDLNLSLGYSHPVKISAVDGIVFSVEGNIIKVNGIDKEQVGLIAALIKSKRKPDAYKGKGVRYEGENIKLKEGKK